MKTPEEIKRGMECKKRAFANNCGDKCSASCGWYIPAYGTHERCADALAYIQRLERERDALMKDVRRRCSVCKSFDREHYNCTRSSGEYVKCVTSDSSLWEWRGAQEGEHGENR